MIDEDIEIPELEDDHPEDWEIDDYEPGYPPSDI